ncbi:beta-N-acetylhexosaminidase [Alteromonadaceae bacterium Bs31]|nr:beta-N-acetylhexosaminidase [Alteromonadaceae bacterium Bs31]
MGPLIADLDGLAVSAQDRQFLLSPWLGGVILFSRNYSNQQQLSALVAEIRAIRPDLLIAVDQEGGRVQRLKNGFTRIPPMQRLGHLYNDLGQEALPAISDVGWLLASELLAFDIDISFAPVLDVDDSLSDVIGDRSFGVSPQVVVAAASAFIDGMQQAGMAVTAKHFPGHGGIKADSHLELPRDERDLEDLKRRDLQPFTALFDRLNAVMAAHIDFPAVDQQIVTFSSHWLKQVLREQLQFKGLVFSDDLSMQGAAIEPDVGSRALRALNAGCDAVLVCNNRDAAESVITALDREYGQAWESRLKLMRGDRQLDWELLQSHPRYRRAKATIENNIV